jgi:hypothetical protein
MAILDASRALRVVLERELAPSREQSLALTKLDELGFWAAAGYARQNGAGETSLELRQYDELGAALGGRPAGFVGDAD